MSNNLQKIARARLAIIRHQREGGKPLETIADILAYLDPCQIKMIAPLMDYLDRDPFRKVVLLEGYRHEYQLPIANHIPRADHNNTREWRALNWLRAEVIAPQGIQPAG